MFPTYFAIFELELKGILPLAERPPLVALHYAGSPGQQVGCWKDMAQALEAHEYEKEKLYLAVPAANVALDEAGSAAARALAGSSTNSNEAELELRYPPNSQCRPGMIKWEKGCPATAGFLAFERTPFKGMSSLGLVVDQSVSAVKP